MILEDAKPCLVSTPKGCTTFEEAGFDDSNPDHWAVINQLKLNVFYHVYRIDNELFFALTKEKE